MSRFNKIVKPRYIVARGTKGNVTRLAELTVGADLEKGRIKRRTRHEAWLRHEREVVA